MITELELVELGFKKQECLNGDFVLGNSTITLTDGKIDFIREKDNYHGLSVSINSIEGLRRFLLFLSNQTSPSTPSEH